jgi:CBS domain-containing protein
LRCGPETAIGQAIDMMREANCSSIIVTRDHLPVGIWTERTACPCRPTAKPP